MIQDLKWNPSLRAEFDADHLRWLSLALADLLSVVEQLAFERPTTGTLVEQSGDVPRLSESHQ